MADPFVAEIRIFPFNFAPTGWAFCDGQLLPISQNTALFSLLGTIYGGDGKSTFALPDLQGTRADAPGPGPGPVACTTSARSAARRRSRCCESEMPAHTHAMTGQTRTRRDVKVASPERLVRAQQAARCTRATRQHESGAAGARARWRQPAAQQPDAVPDVQLLHRASRLFSHGRCRAAPANRPSLEDRDFLVTFTTACASPELAHVPWDGSARRASLSTSSTPQDTHYHRHYPGASLDVIEFDAKRRRSCTAARGIRIMDIALMQPSEAAVSAPAFLRTLIAEAGGRAAVHPRRDRATRPACCTSVSAFSASRSGGLRADRTPPT